MTATTPRPRLPRTLADLEDHPWVDWIDDSRHLGDGLHVYLRPGYVWDDTVSAVVEPTVKEACQAFREVAWDPAAWGVACGASAAEVAALTGEAAPVAPAAPAPAAPAPAAPAPAAGRRLNPLAEMLLTRLAATGAPCLLIERLPLWDALAENGWIEMVRVGRMQEGKWCECRITALGRAVLDARPCDCDAAPVPRPVLPGEATPPPAPSHGDAAPSLPKLRADAAAGHPVSLSAVVRAAQSEMAARPVG